jgi:hypothetical protein
MADKKANILLILLTAAITFLLTIFLFNVYAQVWTNYFLLDIMYLGYIFIGIAVAAVAGFFLSKSAKWKINFAFLSVWCIIQGILYLASPDWFNIIWIV